MWRLDIGELPREVVLQTTGQAAEGGFSQLKPDSAVRAVWSVGLVVGCGSFGVTESSHDPAGEPLEAVHLQHQQLGSPEAGGFGGRPPSSMGSPRAVLRWCLSPA